MSELNLTLTEKFSAQANNIQSALSVHLKVGQPQIYSMRSIDPPSYILLLGGFLAWKVLYPPAKAFLETLAKRAAEEAWDKIVNKEEVKPLTDVVTTLVDAKTHINGEVHIDVGLDIPDDYSGTTLSIKSSDPERAVYEFATFLVHVEPLSKAMKEEIAAGRKPFGRATITILEDESLLVNWITQDEKTHEIQVTRIG